MTAPKDRPLRPPRAARAGSPASATAAELLPAHAGLIPSVGSTLSAFAPRPRGDTKAPTQGGGFVVCGYMTCVDDEEVSDAEAAEDEKWLASLPPSQRALVGMMLDRLVDAENDSTYRPDYR
ncbi:hypothetical protein GCM10009551_001730 [Nocardiopsis tropica]